MASAAESGALRPEEVSTSESVVRSAGIVSIAVLLSRVTGLVREIALARLFGAGMSYDAFLLGFRIPNLTRDLFAEGALSSAFVPAFVTALTRRSKQEAAELANLVATAILIIVGALCLLGTIFAPALVGLLAPGFQDVPGKFDLAVRMTRIMFPFLLLVALAAQVMGMLNALNQFAMPALSSTFFNAGSLAAGLLLGLYLGPLIGISAIEGMAWGVVIGGALQLAVQLPSTHRAGFSFRLRIDPANEGLRQILRLMGPAIIGNAAVQVNVMVNTIFASRIGDAVRGLDGPVSWLAYAFRFMQLPLGLFGVAIGSATLPAISRSASSGEMDEFRRTLSRSLGMVFLLTIPSSAGLALLGRSMIGAIYQGGQFQAYDTQQTALALSCFAIGLGAYSGIKVLTPAFYALNDSRTPMFISLSSIVINYVAASLLTQRTSLGHAGLALSTSFVAVFGFLALFWIMRNRSGGIYGRALTASLAKVLFASAVMSCAVAGSSHAVLAWLGESRLAHLADLGISIPAALVIYYWACRMVRVPELELASRAIAGPLMRLRAKIQ